MASINIEEVEVLPSLAHPSNSDSQELIFKDLNKNSPIEVLNSVIDEPAYFPQQLDVKDFLNERGKPRLKQTQYYYDCNSMSNESLIGVFWYWRSYVEYIRFQLIRKNYEGMNEKRLDVLKICSKRGNEVYRWRLKKRFKEIGDIEEIKFFDFDDEKAETPCLFLTLTYDIKRCSMKEAWKNIGNEWNRYITKLRKKFGKIDVIRVWESTERGYPHIHAILYFVDRKFDILFMSDKHNVKIARIKEKVEFEGYHSFVDVFGVDSLSTALNYILKYLFKVHSENSGYKAKLTLANLWIHQKRCFSISGDFINDLISARHNSNSELKGQSNLKGEIIDKWVRVGFYNRDEVKEEFGLDAKGEWVFVLSRSVSDSPLEILVGPGPDPGGPEPLSV